MWYKFKRDPHGRCIWRTSLVCTSPEIGRLNHGWRFIWWSVVVFESEHIIWWFDLYPNRHGMNDCYLKLNCHHPLFNTPTSHVNLVFGARSFQMILVDLNKRRPFITDRFAFLDHHEDASSRRSPKSTTPWPFASSSFNLFTDPTAISVQKPLPCRNLL